MHTFFLFLVYAGLLLAGGLRTWLLAPDRSRATTALVVPGIAALVVLVVAFWNRARARAGAAPGWAGRVALFLPLLFAVGIGMQARKAARAVAEAPERSYQFEGMLALAIVSALVFVAGLALRARARARARARR
jgi:F0F1-type ATP synthase membrane subunit c/vacuolar-type H+-ATPase subunit K